MNPVDNILIIKSTRLMQLPHGEKTLKSYRIALGKNPIGPKLQEGDNRTPEGEYYISTRNPESAYHLSLRISYPNRQDILRSAELGVNPGTDIYIHGYPNNDPQLLNRENKQDWTTGCIAVTNREIEKIWNLVANGTFVTILA